MNTEKRKVRDILDRRQIYKKNYTYQEKPGIPKKTELNEVSFDEYKAAITILESCMEAGRNATNLTCTQVIEQIRPFDEPSIGVCARPPNAFSKLFETSCLDMITILLSATKRKVDIMAYELSQLRIVIHLILALLFGNVKVRIIIDQKKLGTDHVRVHLLALYLCGAELKVDCFHDMHHNKVMIFDDESVMTGSYNFSEHSQKENAENITVSSTDILVKSYIEMFEMHWIRVSNFVVYADADETYKQINYVTNNLDDTGVHLLYASRGCNKNKLFKSIDIKKARYGQAPMWDNPKKIKPVKKRNYYIPTFQKKTESQKKVDKSSKVSTSTYNIEKDTKSKAYFHIFDDNYYYTPPDTPNSSSAMSPNSSTFSSKRVTATPMSPNSNISTLPSKRVNTTPMQVLPNASTAPLTSTPIQVLPPSINVSPIKAPTAIKPKNTTAYRQPSYNFSSSSDSTDEDYNSSASFGGNQKESDPKKQNKKTELFKRPDTDDDFTADIDEDLLNDRNGHIKLFYLNNPGHEEMTKAEILDYFRSALLDTTLDYRKKGIRAAAHRVLYIDKKFI